MQGEGDSPNMKHSFTIPPYFVFDTCHKINECPEKRVHILLKREGGR
jgi:hypothetical protein